MITSRILEDVPGIVHGFGTLEEPMPPFVGESIEDSQSPRWKQVHGTQSVEVTSVRQECGEVDALYSKIISVPISVVTADCVPILMAHKNGLQVAAIHAGWRGTKARIVRKLWEKISMAGENPKDWVVAVGPAIGPCCYEVSEELAQDFCLEFVDLDKQIVLPRKRHLDLPAIHAQELKQMGFGKIDLIRACTQCSTHPLFHSFRREGGKTRQWSSVMRLKKP